MLHSTPHRVSDPRPAEFPGLYGFLEVMDEAAHREQEDRRIIFRFREIEA